MLTTQELHEAIALIPYPREVKNKEERLRLRNEYGQKVRKLEQEWADWLADEYASDFLKITTDRLFTWAWAEGHSAGYNDVESQYINIADFTRNLFKDVRK